MIDISSNRARFSRSGSRTTSQICALAVLALVSSFLLSAPPASAETRSGQNWKGGQVISNSTPSFPDGVFGNLSLELQRGLFGVVSLTGGTQAIFLRSCQELCRFVSDVGLFQGDIRGNATSVSRSNSIQPYVETTFKNSSGAFCYNEVAALGGTVGEGALVRFNFIRTRPYSAGPSICGNSTTRYRVCVIVDFGAPGCAATTFVGLPGPVTQPGVYARVFRSSSVSISDLTFRTGQANDLTMIPNGGPFGQSTVPRAWTPTNYPGTVWGNDNISVVEWSPTVPWTQGEAN